MAGVLLVVTAVSVPLVAKYRGAANSHSIQFNHRPSARLALMLIPCPQQ